MKRKTQQRSKEESSDRQRLMPESKRSLPAPKMVRRRSPEPDADMDLRVSDILEAFPSYVMLIDEDHHILRANAAVRKGLGLNPEAIVGKYCPEVVHGQKGPWYACPLEESLEKWAPVEREALDPGSGRWIRSAIYPTAGLTREGKRIFFHIVSDITRAKEVEQELKTSRQQLEVLSQHLESVREEERTSLAREIHDDLGHILTSLKIDLSWLNKRVTEEQAEKVKSTLDLIDGAILTAKRISTELRPGVLDDLGLSAAIEWQSQEFERHTRLKCDFKSSPGDIIVDRERSTAIFRICQEVLTNVARHANATRVKLRLKKYRSKIVLAVKDDGQGIDEKRVQDPKSFGLIGMRERVRFWGGEVTIRGTPGKGTVVNIGIPLSKKGNFDAQNTDR